jgi:hypothetical protein
LTDITVTIGNACSIGADLILDEFAIPLYLMQNLFIDGAGHKLLEGRIEFKKIFFLLNLATELHHFMVSLLGEDKKGDVRVSVQIKQICDIGRHEFEYKHYIVAVS